MTPPIRLDNPTPERTRKRAALLVLLLLAAALVPIWSLHFLPLQDYPQNLFQAKLTSHVLAGHPLNSSTYEVRLKPTYSAFFLLVWLFEYALPLWAAGKAAASVYFVLTAWATWRLMWFTARDPLTPGWAALLLFPLGYNQIYFLGFFHYLYAMPLLLLALMHLLTAAKEGWRTGRVIAHALWLLVLLWVHPFAIVIYGMLAGLWVFPIAPKIYRPGRTAVGLGMAILLAIGWTIPGLLGRGGAAGSVSTYGIYFQPIWENGAFFLEMFTGMRVPSSPEPVSVLLWMAVLVVLGWEARKFSRGQWPLLFMAAAGAALLLAFVLFTPFGSTNASYLNVRTSLAVYLLLTLAAALIPFSRAGLCALVTLCVLLIANSFLIQHRVAAETAEIEPVIAAMQPDATVLPLLFNRDSPNADPFFFSLHMNDHFYYQVEKGGISPYLLEAPAEGRAPVFFRPGADPPAPPQYFPTDFRWEKYGAPYRYFLVRGGNESVFRYMAQHATLRVTSGEWRLYEKNEDIPPTGVNVPATSPARGATPSPGTAPVK